MTYEACLRNVYVDAPYAPTPDRVRYRVTLACGSLWWEDRGVAAAPPKFAVCRCERHDACMSRDAAQADVSSPRLRPPSVASPRRAGPAAE